MSQRIIVEIQQDGQINVETKGIKGPKCRDYIRVLEQLLEAETIDSSYTAEYFETEQVDVLRHQQIIRGTVMANGYTNKGVKWELFQSIWVLFVFTPFGFWVSFFYIFARAKQKMVNCRMDLFCYFLFTILSNGTPLFNAAMVLLIIGWGVSIVHALKVRPEF